MSKIYTTENCTIDPQDENLIRCNVTTTRSIYKDGRWIDQVDKRVEHRPIENSRQMGLKDFRHPFFSMMDQLEGFMQNIQNLGKMAEQFDGMSKKFMHQQPKKWTFTSNQKRRDKVYDL